MGGCSFRAIVVAVRPCGRSASRMAVRPRIPCGSTPISGDSSVRLGFDKNGVFYYSVNPTVADLYVATIDPTSLKVTTAPQPVVAEDGGTHGPGAWSADGRLLAYLVSNERGVRQLQRRDHSLS